jgi:lysylphosphatidylglycerol synthetase-like protein (DUF2156 family)
MSTTPPEHGTTGTTGTGGTVGGGMGANRPMVALPGTLPIPGNAEAVFLVLAALALAVLAWVADGLTDRDWWLAFVVLGAAYLLSRGIAKASRVFEQ